MFVSTDKLHVGIYQIPPGGRFEPPDVHAGDELYYILKGTLTMFNPETGDVHKVSKGEVLHGKTEPLAKVEFQWHGGGGRPGTVKEVLEIKAYKDGWLEPENDLGLAGAVPGQPDEPDDIICPPGGYLYAGNLYSVKNGKTVNPWGLPHVDGKSVRFDTENGRRFISYRDVTMALGEREVVIFWIYIEDNQSRTGAYNTSLGILKITPWRW